MSATYQPGVRVCRASSPDQVGIVVRADARFATVFWATGREETVPLESLTSKDLANPVCSPAELFTELVQRRLDHPLTDQLLSYRASRTRLLPHQFGPVRKFVANPAQRLLIADEVGTGKTIEAGLVWAELEARSREGLGSVLIVCPKALITKWQGELQQRFDLRVESLDSAAWRSALVAAQRDGVWSPRFSHGVVGLELARREELLALLGETDCNWDLVIIDEAHELRNPETLSHALGQLLAERAAAMLLLTATPAHTSLEDLRSLFRILSVELASDAAVFAEEIRKDSLLNVLSGLVRALPPGWRGTLARELDALTERAFGRQKQVERLRHLLPGEPPTPAERVAFLGAVTDAQAFAPFMTRTMRGDVEVQRPVRQAAVHRVPFNQAQQDFYNGVYAITFARARAQGSPPGFVTQMPERRTASCAPSVAEEILALASEAEDEPEHSTSFEKSEVAALAPLARRVLDAPDDKSEMLVQVIRDLAAQGYSRVIVFSTFRGTLRYLEHRLAAAGLRVAQIHGGIPAQDEDCRPGEVSREAIAAAFRKGAFDVLLGSEVIGQGLDFEHCSAVVNYDLPWNPMRVEQRIGRIDRLGQAAEKIIVASLTTPGTIESRILDRLYLRLGVFEQALGELEMVLGDELEGFTKELFSGALTATQQEERLDRVARAVEERRRQSALVEEEHGSLLSAVQRVEVETAAFRDLERSFLSARELQTFVVDTLCRRGGPETARVRDDGLTEIDLHGLADELSSFSRALPGSSSARDRARRLAARARNPGERLIVSFVDGEYHEKVEFAHVRHPVVGLCRHLSRATRTEARMAAGTIERVTGLPAGGCIAAWAIASYEGLVSRVELLEVVVDRSGQPVELPTGCSARAWLAEAAPTVAPPDIDVGTTLRSLERRLAERASEGRAALLERNAAAAARAVTAVRSSVDARRRWLQSRLALHDLDPRLRRMYGGWDARLARELERKLQELESRSHLDFKCEFLGAAVLDPSPGAL